MCSFKKIFLYIIYILFCLARIASAQVDTKNHDVGDGIEIISYSLAKSPASVDTIEPNLHQANYSIVSGLNTLPGVRMEERSPGSYRLSIRGSLLRSPFGVRNIKVYIDDFLFTDAGGNTYLNALDPSSIRSMEVWRGPYGSLYGANTGGVVRIRSYDVMDTARIKASVTSGSYNLFHQTIAMQHSWKKQFISINQAYQQSDGYRNQSALKRQFYKALYYIDYHKDLRLKVLAFYSDLNYQTPGGLTLQQFNDNPKASRPSSVKIPSAEQQHAAIQNEIIYGGISNDAKLSKRLRHVISIFGTQANFVNPAITNYETRKEITFGTRTYLETTGGKTYRFLWNWNLGLEWQKTNAVISNYRNAGGIRDTLQVKTNLNARQYFVFSQFSAALFSRLIIEAGLSLNKYTYQYQSVLKAEDWSSQQFKMQLLPRLALSYKIREQLLWRASISKGYSSPTLAEIRPNDAVVHTDLQPEFGWNYETGLRFQNKRLNADLTIFYYALKQAIVSRSDATGTQYFINSGGTKQPGLETKLSYQFIKVRSYGFIRSLEVKNSMTFYMFSFDQYIVGNNDYSNNRLTGVPRSTIVTSIYVDLLKRLYVYVQYNHTSQVPLNDANNVYAKAYHLLQAKAGWSLRIKNQLLGIYIGVDNILNQQYSLGNDLNAFGGRYYNAAALRNYYLGLSFTP
jgi:iron complex outermembrane receptor protein